MNTKIYNHALYRTPGTPGEQALACPKSMFQQDGDACLKAEAREARFFCIAELTTISRPRASVRWRRGVLTDMAN